MGHIRKWKTSIDRKLKLTHSTALVICNLGQVIIVWESKQKEIFGSQPFRIEFEFSADVSEADYIAYAVLVFCPKLISISSVGQRHFDLK